MEKIFPIGKDFCNIFKKKNSPVFTKVRLPKYLTSSISKWTLQFAKENYFKNRLCFLHNKTDHLFYFNYPNIEVVDDFSLLFLFKIYRLYEMNNVKALNYHSKKESIMLFNNKVKMNNLQKIAFILSYLEGETYKINFTNEEINLLQTIDQTIKNSLILDLENSELKDNLFNTYLRRSIITPDFLNEMATKKIKRNDFEKFIEKKFNEMKKQDKNFIQNSRKQFDIEYRNLMQKLDHFYKSDEYKKFLKTLKVTRFRFPMKEYFGENRPLQYQLFKSLVDTFEKEVREKINAKK